VFLFIFFRCSQETGINFIVYLIRKYLHDILLSFPFPLTPQEEGEGLEETEDEEEIQDNGSPPTRLTNTIHFIIFNSQDNKFGANNFKSRYASPLNV
jgi:hypothetical protein